MSAAQREEWLSKDFALHFTACWRASQRRVWRSRVAAGLGVVVGVVVQWRLPRTLANVMASAWMVLDRVA